MILQIHTIFLKTCEDILQKTYSMKNNYVYPYTIPDCPFIFKDISQIYKTFEKNENDNNKCLKKYIEKSHFVKEKLQTSINCTRQTSYTKTILLTYSEDANIIVDNILTKLRKGKGNMKLGVVILNEQIGRVNIEPEQFIYDCFLQVDYVVPIITKGYIQMIGSSSSELNYGQENIDNRYVKYIYALMNTYYLRNNCRNFKIRSLIPDNSISTIQHHRMMGHSLFQVWFKISDIEMIMERILQGTL